MLTQRQRQLFDYLDVELSNGRTPTMQEMVEAVGLHSRATAHELLRILDERGFIQRGSALHGRTRPIEILRQPSHGTHYFRWDDGKKALVRFAPGTRTPKVRKVFHVKQPKPREVILAGRSAAAKKGRATRRNMVHARAAQ